MKRKLGLAIGILLLPILLWVFYKFFFAGQLVRYSITDLGVLPNGNSSFAMDINNRAQVVGIAETAIGKHATFVWSATDGMRDIGIPLFNCRINDNGMVVGRTGTGGATEEMVVWTEESGIDRIGNTGPHTTSIGMNNHGIVVWSHPSKLVNGKSTYRSFVYTPQTGTTEIASATTMVIPLDIDDKGLLIGSAKGISGRLQGFYSEDFKVLHFLQHPTEPNAELHPFRVFSDGSFFVVAELSIGRQGLIYRDGDFEDLQVSFNGNNRQELQINDSNGRQTVGAIDTELGVFRKLLRDLLTLRLSGLREFETRERAVLWERGEPIDLISLVPSSSGWTELESAQAINERGQIVGTGKIGDDQHAFLLTPIEEPE